MINKFELTLQLKSLKTVVVRVALCVMMQYSKRLMITLPKCPLPSTATLLNCSNEMNSDFGNLKLTTISSKKELMILEQLNVNTVCIISYSLLAKFE